MAEPMTAEDLARLRAEHFGEDRAAGYLSCHTCLRWCCPGGMPGCRCSDPDCPTYVLSPFPCAAALLLAELERREHEQPHASPGIPWHEYLGVEYHVHTAPACPHVAPSSTEHAIAYGLLGPQTSEELAR